MDIWNLYIYVSWEMLIKGNSLSYRCPLHPEQSRWEQNWTCSPKPSSMNLSWTQTLLSLSALSLLLMAQCLSLFPTLFSFWCPCYWLLTAQSSCSMLAGLLLGNLFFQFIGSEKSIPQAAPMQSDLLGLSFFHLSMKAPCFEPSTPSHCLPRCCPGAWLQLGALGDCLDVLLQ